VCCIVGDDSNAKLLDIRANGKWFADLKGRIDHCFSVSILSSASLHIATGGQDSGITCLYDLRKYSKPFYKLQAQMSGGGPIANLHYSPNSKYLAVMEADDYLTLYDVNSGYKQSQTIDVFGKAPSSSVILITLRF
jgi:WD40 repeat protein